ncbi:VOC family protein [Lysobacter sp. CFH 32150]|uniref:VOC family protein n=1 Tax=Lysobacter sp. CFH 32150 TaxID=2927128 RepID=UPI0031F325B9
MSGPADSGLFIYAKDILRVAAFYESILGMARRHATSDLVVLQGSGLQLVVHALAPEIATAVAISDPPIPRDNAALKFFFTVPSLASARKIAPALGGVVLSQEYSGRGFRASNAVDPEGNIFHLRESAS